MWCRAKGWCGFGRVSGVAIPPVVARIFVGDSTSPLTRDGHGCPKFCRTQNKQSVHKARALCEARVFCHFTMVVGMERFGATGGASKARMP